MRNLISNLSATSRRLRAFEGRLWFAEYQGNAIGMFDPRTEKFSEWMVPTPWSSPYDAAAGRNGEAWTAGMSSDRVVRLDTKTGEITEYPRQLT
jgi:virginiamycin B lyase